MAIKLAPSVRKALKATISTYINAALDAVWADWQKTATLGSNVLASGTSFVSSADLGNVGTGEALFASGTLASERLQVNFGSRVGSNAPYTYTLIDAFKLPHLAGIAIVSEPDTGVVIPKVYPKHIYDGNRLVIPEYPTIAISSMNGRQTTNAAPYWGQFEHHVDVSVILQGDDEFTLEQQKDRYLIALWEIFMQHQTLDDSLTGETGIDPLEYGDSGVFKPNKGSSLMMLAGGWSIAVHADETV
jgi:hypothetical protein